MECVYIVEAKYIENFRVYLKFNTGEEGEADLEDIVYKYGNAESLRTPLNFKNFYLDNWPTLAWECGFDISPESLYYKVTGKEQHLLAV